MVDVPIRASEKSAQSTIVDLARWRRWSVYHTFDSRKSQGGFPDLTLSRTGDRNIFAELKRVGEKPRPDQVEWLDRLASAGGEVYLWTINDLHFIGRILERKWAFVPFGETCWLSNENPDGPCLLDDEEGLSLQAPSAWIPGHGRRDA